MCLYVDLEFRQNLRSQKFPVPSFTRMQHIA